MVRLYLHERGLRVVFGQVVVDMMLEVHDSTTLE